MSPRRSKHARWFACLAAVVCALACLEASAQDEADAPPADPLERYLESLGLDDLLGAYLRDRLASAPPEERPEIAERLAKLYAAQLNESESEDASSRVERWARDLLSHVPESEANELRVTLARARYLRVEQVGENELLRLTTPEEIEEATGVLREVLPVLREVVARVDRRIGELERLERSPRASVDEQLVRDELGEARRVRSLARYYSGWTNLHMAILTRSRRYTDDALQDFAWLVNSPGERRPSVERAPVSLLRYDHVARSVIGCALACSLADEHVDAVRWMDVLESEDAEVAERVQPQVFARRLLVLGRARRWADLEAMVNERHRERPPTAGDDGERTLKPLEARLLAIVALEGLADPGARNLPERDRLLEALAQIGLGDLVERGELGHVLDLVSRYGTAPIGEEGFVVRYVRAVQAYERARQAHAEAGEDTEQPTQKAEVANRYRAAAGAFDEASESDDAGKYTEQASRSQQVRGLALFYAGDFMEASLAFESGASTARDPGERDDALWFALLALDRAIDGGRVSEEPRRERLTALYLEEFPGTERAARLLLRRASAGLVSDDEAIEILLSVPKSSEVYWAARRHAATLLYRVFRRAPSAARGATTESLGDRFVRVASELLDHDVLAARDLSDPEVSGEAARRLVTLGRQMLDAILASAAPDAERAERVMSVVRDSINILGENASELEGELAFRWLQIAIARNDDSRIERAMDDLIATGGRFVEAGDRLLYRRALERWLESPEDVSAADLLVRAGLRVLDQFEPLDEHKSDATMRSVLSRTAAAAAAVWEANDDEVMRDTALGLDRRAVELGAANADTLRRFGAMAEECGYPAEAIEAWRTLGSALAPGTDGWLEARYNAIRLLADDDPVRARAALQQLLVLYPEIQAEPWGTKLEELSVRLGAGSGG